MLPIPCRQFIALAYNLHLDASPWRGSPPRRQLDTLLSPAILCPMPRPKSEREALEHELREELPAQLAEYQRELAATPSPSTERREWLTWQIRRVEKRTIRLTALLREEPQ